MMYDINFTKRLHNRLFLETIFRDSFVSSKDSNKLVKLFEITKTLFDIIGKYNLFLIYLIV